MACNHSRKYYLSFIPALIAIAITPATFIATAQTSTPPKQGHAMPQTERYQPLPRTRNLAGPAVGRAEVAVPNDNPLDGAQALFVPPRYYQPTDALSVAIADVNLDGIPDLIVGGASSGVSVLLGNGDGTFQNPVSYSSGGDWTWSVAIADVNRDGKPDIVVANTCQYSPPQAPFCTEGSVGVLLGRGDGTFNPVYVVDGVIAGAIAVRDFNEDGNPDLAVVNWHNDTLDVLLGNGDGTFRSPVSYGGRGGPVSLAVADVNRDGHLDLLAANYCSYADCYKGSVGVLLGRGDGTFQPEVFYDTVPAGVTSTKWTVSVAAADVNGDGVPDLVVLNNNGDSVGILLGNGDGTFQPVAIRGYGSFWAPAGIVVADVNGDGKQDVVVGDYTGYTTIGILLGNGDGTFQPNIGQSVGDYVVSSLALADLDGNGKPDLALAMGRVGVMLHVGDIPTTPTVSSSINPATFGQGVTLIAAVSSSSGVPEGTVELFDSSSSLGSATLISGSGSISVSSFGAGPHEITALYQGSTKFKPSASAPLSQIVNMATTTNSLSLFPNPAGPGQRVTYTVKVNGQYGGVATGKVTLWDDGSQIGAVTLKDNRASDLTSYPAVGTHSITAKYSGDSNNSASTSATFVEQIADTTSTSLTTSGSPSMPGQPVTFTATVTSLYGTIPDGELVTFDDGTTVMGSVPLSGGKAVYTTSSLSGGKTHYISAKYPGDATFAPSSGTVTQVVKRYPTTTTFVSSPNPSTYGQIVTWTATVTTTGPDEPTGSVRFVGAFGPGTLSAGTAIYRTAWLQAGTQAVTAEYQGDAANAPSSSAAANQVVNPAPTTTTLTSSPNPSSAGQTVTFTAKVKSSTGASPVGTVTFTAGTTVLGTVKIGNSPTSISTSTLPAGSTAVKATYNDVLDFVGSTGTTTQTVNQ